MVRFGVLVSLTLVVFLILPSLAQITDVTDTTSTPIPGAGHDYVKMLNESVSPANGSVSVRIQVPSPPGRRLSLPFAFEYDSNSAAHLASLNDGAGGIGWADNFEYLGKGGWSYSVPTLTNLLVNEALAGRSGRCVYYSNYVFQDETGGRHSLYLSIDLTPSTCSSGTPIIPIQKLTGGDPYYSAALTTTSAPLLVADADGTVYSFARGGQQSHQDDDNVWSSLVSSIEDRNGNLIAVHDLNAQHAGSFSATDTLGRTILSTSGFGTSGDTITVSGLPNPYTVTWGTSTASKAVGAVLVQQTDPAGCTPVPPLNGNNIVTQITLPNNASYKFSFDSIYGLLSKITYPDGGFVSYTYALNPLSEFESFQGQSGVLNGCFWHHDTPAVGTRSVSFDGTTIALQQTFTYSTTWSSNTSWSSKTTTVTTTDNVSGLTYSNVYTYTPYVAPRQPNDYSQYAPQIPVESTIVTKNSQGTTQRTVQKTWANQYELLSQQTTLEDGSTCPMHRF